MINGCARLSAVVALVWACTCTAQEDVHWAYASYFGTGRYELNGGVDTAVLSLAPGWTWREPGFDASGRPSPGFRFRFPVTVGAHEFSSLDSIDEFNRDSINAVSVVPGVEIEWPLSERLRVKSLSYAGYGTDTHGDVDAKIFRLGFRSSLKFPLRRTDLYLVNGLERIGFSADDGASDAINLAMVGLDFTRPLPEKKWGGDEFALHWHIMFTNFLDSVGLDVSELSLRPGIISSEWEMGVAFGKQDSRIEFWRLKLDRIGLSYRLGEGGDFSGIGISFRSLFDR